MAQPASPPSEYQFAVFVADVRACELRKHGTRIKLQELPFQLLTALLERPGEVVTREELRQRLWPEGTFVDFDHNISSAINKLRGALNDSATHPRYIETVGRRGYRFLYPVTTISPEGAARAGELRGGRARPAPSRVLLALLATAVLIATAAGLALLLRKPVAPAERIPGTIHSLAVLPLKNLSSDPEQEYFSDGMTEELITQLASVQGLRVISRTSAMQYKDSKKPLAVIAHELNVDAVVEGSVLRAGGKVRITAQLVDVASDQHLWASNYERDQKDVLALQQEVAGDIAENIRRNLTPTGQARLATEQPVDPGAHEDYLRARFYFVKRNGDDMRTAIRYFETATARDPSYARAYAGLADSYALLGGYTGRPQTGFIVKARAAALKAVELDSRLAEPHASLAVIAQNYDWDWQTAEREYREAIRLDPNYATAHHWYAEYLSYQGRFGEALAESDRALQLDPLSLIIATDRGEIFFYGRQYERAAETLRQVLHRDPDFPRARGLLQAVYIEQRKHQEALTEAMKYPTDSPWRMTTTARAYVGAGDRAKALAIVAQLERMIRERRLDAAPLCYVYATLGDKDRAFAAFEQAYRQHANTLTTLKVNPAYDPLRGDPRYSALMKRVGLAP